MKLLELETGELLFEIEELGSSHELREQYVQLAIEDEDRLKLSKQEYEIIRQKHIERVRRLRGNKHN